MNPIEDADELKAVAQDFGLRVSDLRTGSSASRFTVALDDGVDADRVYVHASPARITITLDLSDGESQSLSYEAALERMLEAIGS
ncbi:MAG: hypothetical protein ACC658_00945 [Acidimicrobiia bacterium]